MKNDLFHKQTFKISLKIKLDWFKKYFIFIGFQAFHMTIGIKFVVKY
jgi:hypothetical protein